MSHRFKTYNVVSCGTLIPCSFFFLEKWTAVLWIGPRPIVPSPLETARQTNVFCKGLKAPHHVQQVSRPMMSPGWRWCPNNIGPSGLGISFLRNFHLLFTENRGAVLSAGP